MNGSLIDDLLGALPDGRVLDVRVGAFCTAVAVETGGVRRCGIASSMRSAVTGRHGETAVEQAGRLTARSAAELAERLRSERVMEAAIGMAAVNALLPPPPASPAVPGAPPADADGTNPPAGSDSAPPTWATVRIDDRNAFDILAREGRDRHVVVAGHFPFIPRLRELAGRMTVLELQPGEGDLPAGEASRVVPEADVLALTGTSIVNHTFHGMMALCHPGTLVLALGASAPLSPILFDHGVHVICGAVVEDTDAVLRAASQGANMRQIHRQGVRLVTMRR